MAQRWRHRFGYVFSIGEVTNSADPLPSAELHNLLQEFQPVAASLAPSVDVSALSGLIPLSADGSSYDADAQPGVSVDWVLTVGDPLDLRNSSPAVYAVVPISEHCQGQGVRSRRRKPADCIDMLCTPTLRQPPVDVHDVQRFMFGGNNGTDRTMPRSSALLHSHLLLCSLCMQPSQNSRTAIAPYRCFVSRQVPLVFRCPIGSREDSDDELTRSGLNSRRVGAVYATPTSERFDVGRRDTLSMDGHCPTDSGLGRGQGRVRSTVPPGYASWSRSARKAAGRQCQHP